VTAGVALAKPDVIGRGFTTPSDAFNDLFDQAALMFVVNGISHNSAFPLRSAEKNSV
jgi:hypothetical protein